MSLQIVTVKEIEKERNRRYDTSDRHTRAIDLYAACVNVVGLSAVKCDVFDLIWHIKELERSNYSEANASVFISLYVESSKIKYRVFPSSCSPMYRPVNDQCPSAKSSGS